MRIRIQQPLIFSSIYMLYQQFSKRHRWQWKVLWNFPGSWDEYHFHNILPHYLPFLCVDICTDSETVVPHSVTPTQSEALTSRGIRHWGEDHVGSPVATDMFLDWHKFKLRLHVITWLGWTTLSLFCQVHRLDFYLLAPNAVLCHLIPLVWKLENNNLTYIHRNAHKSL